MALGCTCLGAYGYLVCAAWNQLRSALYRYILLSCMSRNT